ncbi:PREDICTED: GDSL esterase/lipase At1g71691-like [Erythranthe guttata]|uniref:GDSL esterase/lipase At1g71691-like n=1 Tax=Erythranthe guttata TaxID=4155 RepID=UPI00064DBF4E|nr:PREDICTED: GDSL esterase/lipase At1g71691-like [Erythranthe guttata]|eukprot:XP_012854700.1 PREDICTED: GDSL esterase/lipase At1g71691-like [Erythranthe guttata]
MGGNKKMGFYGWIFVGFLLVMSASGQEDGEVGVSGGRRALVPAMFVFGDSLIDNGNNNDLPSFAKANYFPYGIDFKAGPTGRFSNGYTMVDTIAELLGLPLLPAFSEASGEQMRYGVNYASAAAGILDNTGRNFVSRIPFNQQIKNFENTLDQITDSLGAPDVAQALSKCIFFVGMGSNDYLNNYLMPNYDTKNQYNPQQYADHGTQDCFLTVLGRYPARELKYCPGPDIKRTRSCGAHGYEACFFAVLAHYPASLRPRNIRCVDVGKNRSKCSFEILCA